MAKQVVKLVVNVLFYASLVLFVLVCVASVGLTLLGEGAKGLLEVL